MKKLADYDKQEIKDMPAGNRFKDILVEGIIHPKSTEESFNSWSLNPYLITQMESFIVGLGDVRYYTEFKAARWYVELKDLRKGKSFADPNIYASTGKTHQDALATAILLLVREREIRNG